MKECRKYLKTVHAPPVGCIIGAQHVFWDQGDICNNGSNCIAEYITCGFKLTYGPVVLLLPLATVSSNFHNRFRALVYHSTGGACTVLRYFVHSSMCYSYLML